MVRLVDKIGCNSLIPRDASQKGGSEEQGQEGAEFLRVKPC